MSESLRPRKSGFVTSVLLAVSSFAALMGSGCSSLMYFPSSYLYYDPARFKLRPQVAKFLSEDGTPLYGWYFQAKQQPAKGLVVQFHGNAQNLSSHYVAMVWIIEHGYDFFTFDYQGYGQSQGSPSPQGTVGDGKAALTWAHQRSPSLPIVVFGQSLGGAVAMRTVAEMKDRLPIRMLAVDSTFDSYQASARKIMSGAWILWPFQWLSYLVLSDQYAPKDHIASISPIPMLVVHGTDDPVIHYSLGEKVFELAQEPKEFWRIEHGRHTDFLFRNQGENRKRFLEELESALQQRALSSGG